MTSAEVEITVDAAVVVARLAGDIDLADTAEVTTRVLAAVPNDAAGLVVDVSEASYLDSAGIQMLFEFARRLEAGRQAMAVVAGDGSPVRSLLEMTGLRQAASLCASRQDAVAAILSGAGRRY